MLVMLASILIVGTGEELWSRFMPKYLETLGAGVAVIAVYGTIKDFLDAVYQYPGGWLSDRLGRRKALILFILLVIAGYVIYIASRTWEFLLLGTILVMAWESLAQPGIFAIVADSLPSTKRSTGFGVHAILKRVPIVFAPILGGWFIVHFGLASGIKLSLLVSIALALGAIVIVKRFYRESQSAAADEHTFSRVWRTMDKRLKRLLVADCLARWAEGIPNVFIILYVINILKFNTLEFGTFTSVQMITSIVAYIPIARLSDRMNRKPFVLTTFLFFALYPLAIVMAGSAVTVLLAFIIGGLREIGEPARKALIVSLAEQTVRGRTIGLYYFIRGLIVFPASLVGGLLWSLNPTYPFYVACGLGMMGVVIFAVWKFKEG